MVSDLVADDYTPFVGDTVQARKGRSLIVGEVVHCQPEGVWVEIDNDGAELFLPEMMGWAIVRTDGGDE